ncbi:MAG: hypothetical protein WC556_00010 [Candidatus Methanoperedens sp.]
MSIEAIAINTGTQIENLVVKRILAEITKKISKKDPFKYALEQSLDEIRSEKPNDWIILEEIYHNREKIFNKMEIVDAATFQKILSNNGVEPEISSRLYNKLTEKFIAIIKENSEKNPEVFYPYAIKEFEKIGVDNKEIIKSLQNITLNEELYLGRLIEHFEKSEKAGKEIEHLSEIEFELKKGIEIEGKFFRKEGPIWIDFKEDYVVKRDEVKKIIDSFEGDSPYIMIEGNAASGKSVIARNIGYELADKLDVFYINSKEFETHKVDAIFKDVHKLKDNSLVIIEDAHLYPEHCNDFLNDLTKKRNNTIKILFTARPTYNLNRQVISLDKCKKFTLEAFDSADALINKYVEKNKLPQPSDKEIWKLKNLSKESLWILAYFLIAWEPGKPIEINQVYEKVYNDLMELDNKYGINGSHQVIMALAPFYKYEILIERPFLTEELKLDEKTIKKLIDTNEILESDGFLSLHHSALAEIYISSSNKYISLVNSLLYKLRNFDKKYSGHEDYIVNMFRWYLRSKPKNYDDIINQLWFRKTFVITIFKDENTFGAVKDLLEKEIDVEKTVDCVLNILSASFEFGKVLVSVLKIKTEIESDINKIGIFINKISYANKQIGKLVVEDLNLISLRSKIIKEPDIKKIGFCVSKISFASTKIGNALIDSVKLRIETELDIENIGSLISTISSTNSEVGRTLVETLDLNILRSKIEKESDIVKIGVFISIISSANSDVGKKFVGTLDLNILRAKINKEPHINKIGWYIDDISSANSDIGKKFVGTLDPNIIISKLEKELDIYKIGWFIKDISSVSHEIGITLVDIVKSKIEKEPDIYKIGKCIKGISYSNIEIGKAIIDTFDLNILKSKIDKEPNIEKIGVLLSNVSSVNIEVGESLVEYLDLIILKSKIEEESDIVKIGEFIGIISSANSEVGISLVDLVNSKIENEHDLEKIRTCVNEISFASSKVGRELRENLKIKYYQNSF